MYETRSNKIQEIFRKPNIIAESDTRDCWLGHIIWPKSIENDVLNSIP